MRLTVEREDWPLTRPFTIARGTQKVGSVVVVTIEGGGARGRGECEPQAHYDESIESVVAEIHGVRADVEQGMDRSTLLETLPPGAARNAVDCALWDLEAKRRAVSAWQIARLPRPDYITTDYTISLDTPAAMYEEARRYIGWPVLKLKLGGEAADIERVRAVKKAVPNARFTIDANESWSFEHLVAVAPALDRLGVDLIEQPLPAGEDSRLLDYGGPVALCADEACHTRLSLPAIQGRYQVINIKLDKTGGLTEALLLARDARDRGLGLMTGCMTGTSLAMAPATLVASLSDFVDLDGALMLKTDREPAMGCDKGKLQLPVAELWG